MATVRLDFVPPTAAGITKLHIEEAPEKEGTFAEIEEVTAVGSYPNYISYYTTDNASAANGWFRIRWEGADGIFTPYSSPLQGGTKTLVQEIVDRVTLRMPNVNEIIVTQEAQAAVSLVFQTEDPNSIMASEATHKQLRGLTCLVMARTMAGTVAASAASGAMSKFTAGLVSIQSGTTGGNGSGSLESVIKGLLQCASENLAIGMGLSYVLLMEEATNKYCGGASQPVHGVDLTRATLTLHDYGEQNA